MEHVVFFPGPDAAPAFRRFASLDEALRFVEHMRNVEGVTDISLHQLTPVPVSFRTYFKVELPAGETAVPSVAPMAEPMAEPVATASVPDLVHGELVEPVAVPVAEPVAEPLAEPVAEPVLIAGADVVPMPEPAPNGKRSLGFFAS